MEAKTVMQIFEAKTHKKVTAAHYNNMDYTWDIYFIDGSSEHCWESDIFNLQERKLR